MSDYLPILEDIISAADVRISDIKPSDWCEQNRYMTSDVSPIPGMFSYKNSPYTREIVDCLSPDNPAQIIAVMKGAQIGFSTSVIEPGIGWIISQNPGNILFLVGHDDLVTDAVKKVDRMIDSTGIRNLIQSTSGRARNTKSGDTDKMKEFPEGYLKMGISNHKTLRNISMQYGFIDDFEGMKGDTKEAGSTAKLIEKRFSAYQKKMKLFYISTPELKENSNIEPQYLAGDQRKYHIKCPCCNEFIILEWKIKSEKHPKKSAGITWQMDDEGNLDLESVGYTCQKCDGFFDDANKTELLLGGKWIPTKKNHKDPTRRSYHLSSLYSPTYMAGWKKFVQDYLDAHPEGQPRNEAEYKTFVNTTLGETYSATIEGVNAKDLQMNIRPYEIGTVPEKLSIADGNGKIVLLTCGSDLNGKLDDARLDYEIVAHSETGATYSVLHGSIGTFINKDQNPELRAHSTYRFGPNNSVWSKFKEIITNVYEKDTGGKMKIFMTGLDCGYMQDYALQFIDSHTETFIVGLKGNEYDSEHTVDKYATMGIERKSFAQSKNIKNLYLVESNYTKDVLSQKMKLKWDPKIDSKQPQGFMNFPTPSEGLYTFKDYFSHFEAEEKVFDKNKYTWRKKQGNPQNHLYDCNLYSNVAKEIFLDMFFREVKIKNGTWKNYVDRMVRK